MTQLLDDVYDQEAGRHGLSEVCLSLDADSLRTVVDPARRHGRLPMRKIVDVFVTDRIVASYPVIAEWLAGPTLNDEHFVELVKTHMQNSGCYSNEERAVAKLVVRGLQH